MTGADRNWLLEHLEKQARYLWSLTAYAREHPDDVDVPVRVRDEIFTLRETLDTLAVPMALVDNARWQSVSKAPHRAGWPTADDGAK